MGRTPRPSPVVWQLSALPLIDKRTLIMGVLLTNVPYDVARKSGSFRNLINITKTYSVRPYSNKNISLIADGVTTKTKTDANGSFWTIADYQHRRGIDVMVHGRNRPLGIIHNYPIAHKSLGNTLGVISDIDDTIIESFTADFFKRVSVLLFKTPKKRKPIDFTHKLFKVFEERKANTYYVSKSESNLFGTLTNFIEHSGLPKGVLFLTPYMSLWKLLSTKKAKDFKMNRIRFLIENSAEEKYILLGDDSQRDMEIYFETAKAFPKNILKIYIRQTKPKINLSKKQGIESLKNTGIPVKYFKADDDLEESDISSKT
ncbi:App1 family protein [Muricauda sp. 334s03]|uniref:App1 family protein n=2 Tax=Flagellimonas TaxID=444459 RepID=A0ABT5XNJ7_9FLAO|nr:MULTISPECIES: App1 family protein [Allomuricauda]MDF0707460.1 App1 family protein [[Muricauda] okinawensis]MDF0715361.1 App1 family protein [[Muricauda] yonaguniensis]